MGHIRNINKLAALFLAVLFCPVPAFADMGHSGEGKFTRHYAESLFKVTEKGLYSIEMLIVGNELRIGTNTVDVIVHDAEDNDVMGAEITVTPWMPTMGHGVPERPEVSERGGGLYSVDGVEITMPGLWELRVKVRKEKKEDVAVFAFPDVHSAGEMHEHKPTSAGVPEDLNVSHIRQSLEGSFRAAYISDVAPIPINKVHGWRLYVETVAGVPVSDATITIGGDMPEHGHGMPTKPRVKRDLGGGVYEVEGMKFQMPGWWVVYFDISSGGVKDRVTFNLMLK